MIPASDSTTRVVGDDDIVHIEPVGSAIERDELLS